MTATRYLFALLVLCYGTAVWGTPEAVYWVELIDKDGTVVVQRFGLPVTTRVATPALDYGPNFAGVTEPLGSVWWSDQDWSEKVLRKGLAKLRDPSTASPTLREAEESAKVSRLGVWASLPPKEPPVEPAKVDPAPVELGPVEPARADPAPPDRWREFIEFIKLWGGIGSILASLAALIAFLARLMRRTRVFLLFLGPQAVGKTWLWSRLVNPEITKTELARMGVSKLRDRYRQKTSEPFGKHELRPVYETVPGGQPGTHFDELLKRRWLVRTKSIWVVILAPTRDNSVTRADVDDRKIDTVYVAEQLGYLAVPIGALASSRSPKPAMVLAVVTKFDLFSDYDVSHAASEKGRELLASVFADHVARLKEACAKRSIPFQAEFCSALEGWRTEAMLRHIKRSLFQ